MISPTLSGIRAWRSGCGSVTGPTATAPGRLARDATSVPGSPNHPRGGSGGGNSGKAGQEHSSRPRMLRQRHFKETPLAIGGARLFPQAGCRFLRSPQLPREALNNPCAVFPGYKFPQNAREIPPICMLLPEFRTHFGKISPPGKFNPGYSELPEKTATLWGIVKHIAKEKRYGGPGRTRTYNQTVMSRRL